MELRGIRAGPMGGQDHRGQGLRYSISATGMAANSIITAVRQQDYSASVWLRRREKLEHSQQKCIVIFALVCCFAILVALIFSAVDIWGEDEDGITEDNCSKNCRVVLVENIPEDISFLDNGTSHVPLSVGLYNLLDRAIRVVEIVSPLWLLNSSDYESSFQPAARQVKPEQANRDFTLQKLCHLFECCAFSVLCMSLSELVSLPPLHNNQWWKYSDPLLKQKYRYKNVKTLLCICRSCI
uniref:Uncharacterized protein n=1 Tax=Dicentrarchus labrax TaxID=13489 RepID=A0A8P4JWR9_DICLA